ncbi:hypothetical protein OG229_35610 [Streptomyces platensis]|uniref:hypothetical protein n=1 Tax=Streptomyces platensis TaxID=58346 RepID=UPI002E114AE3|nr:hypothetical protein OG229_35610 [Streptomyces platensis]
MAHSPYTVGDVMTRAVVAIGQEARFEESVETMERWQVSALPVQAVEGVVDVRFDVTGPALAGPERRAGHG